MAWIMIAVVAGSIVVSEHKDKEACLGRVATLAEQKIAGKCVEAPSLYGVSGIVGGYYVCGATTCQVK